MANIFGILTTVVLIVALFVASKNKSRYEEEIINVMAEKGRLSVSQDRLKAAQERLADLNEEIPIVQARADELTAEGDEQRAANALVESDIQAKNAEISRKRDQIQQTQEAIASFGNIDQLAQRRQSLRNEIDELEHSDDGVPARIAELDRLNAQAIQIEVDNTTATSILDGYTRGESRPDMQTRIRSIYPSWGFVTLESGGISGVAGNSTMDVIRNDQIIARLQVTAVEPNSASATIIPGTLDEDVTLQVGDSVIPGTLNGTN